MSKVLVIDDETSIANLLAEIIEEQGYEVTVAFDGRQGFELAKSGIFSLIIADVMMPHINGQELCQRLKDEPKAKNTKVVLMSAVTQVVQYGCGNLADAFIPKPFDIGVISQVVERFLDKEKVVHTTGQFLIDNPILTSRPIFS